MPAKLIDVAGLVPGAHEGRGLGLDFLDDLNQADALIHVIDAAGATNEKGEAVPPGSHDPGKDIAFLERELDYWYLKILKKGWEKTVKTAAAEKRNIVKVIAQQLSGLRVTERMTQEAVKGRPGQFVRWTEADLLEISSSLRRQSKPMLIAANKCDLPAARENIQRLRERFPHLVIVPCSGDAELALREAARKGLLDYVPGERQFAVKGRLSELQERALKTIDEHVLKTWGSTGVQQALNSVVFDVLRCIAVFPGGVGKLTDSQGRVLPDCFLLPPGSTALDFAFRIHTDLGEKFIKAIDVKTRQAVGKEHPLKHRDVVEIVTRK